MAILAIKGHLTRGKEIIEILEMLGGKKIGYSGHSGFGSPYYYYIDEYDNITGTTELSNSKAFVTYTLEEFLEKFPYKIGDKILYKTYGIYLRIKTMLWNVEKEQVFYRLGSNKLFVATADELKLCKEETMEADEHPNKDLKRLIRKAESYDKLVNKGFVNIEKVCEWLSDNMKNYAAFDSDMIKDLKKAMEEYYD